MLNMSIYMQNDVKIPFIFHTFDTVSYVSHVTYMPKVCKKETKTLIKQPMPEEIRGHIRNSNTIVKSGSYAQKQE